MKTTIQDLKNIMKVAKHTNCQQNISARISNDERGIKITVSYSPTLNKKEDIYPFWLIDMQEEELTFSVNIQGNDLKEVRNIYNDFITQGNKSFLETFKF